MDKPLVTSCFKRSKITLTDMSSDAMIDTSRAFPRILGNSDLLKRYANTTDPEERVRNYSVRTLPIHLGETESHGTDKESDLRYSLPSARRNEEEIENFNCKEVHADASKYSLKTDTPHFQKLPSFVFSEFQNDAVINTHQLLSTDDSLRSKPVILSPLNTDTFTSHSDAGQQRKKVRSHSVTSLVKSTATLEHRDSDLSDTQRSLINAILKATFSSHENQSSQKYREMKLQELFPEREIPLSEWTTGSIPYSSSSLKNIIENSEPCSDDRRRQKFSTSRPENVNVIAKEISSTARIGRESIPFLTEESLHDMKFSKSDKDPIDVLHYDSATTKDFSDSRNARLEKESTPFVSDQSLRDKKFPEYDKDSVNLRPYKSADNRDFSYSSSARLGKESIPFPTEEDLPETNFSEYDKDSINLLRYSATTKGDSHSTSIKLGKENVPFPTEENLYPKTSSEYDSDFVNMQPYTSAVSEGSSRSSSARLGKESMHWLPEENTWDKKSLEDERDSVNLQLYTSASKGDSYSTSGEIGKGSTRFFPEENLRGKKSEYDRDSINLLHYNIAVTERDSHPSSARLERENIPFHTEKSVREMKFSEFDRSSVDFRHPNSDIIEELHSNTGRLEKERIPLRTEKRLSDVKSSDIHEDSFDLLRCRSAITERDSPSSIAKAERRSIPVRMQEDLRDKKSTECDRDSADLLRYSNVTTEGDSHPSSTRLEKRSIPLRTEENISPETVENFINTLRRNGTVAKENVRLNSIKLVKRSLPIRNEENVYNLKSFESHSNFIEANTSTGTSKKMHPLKFTSNRERLFYYYSSPVYSVQGNVPTHNGEEKTKTRVEHVEQGRVHTNGEKCFMRSLIPDETITATGPNFKAHFCVQIHDTDNHQHKNMTLVQDSSVGPNVLGMKHHTNVEPSGFFPLSPEVSGESHVDSFTAETEKLFKKAFLKTCPSIFPSSNLKEMYHSSTGVKDFTLRFLKFLFIDIGCFFCIGGIVPLIMLVLGAVYMNQCPAQPTIPVYLLWGGIFGSVENILALTIRYFLKFMKDQKDSRLSKLMVADMVIQIFLTIWFLAGCVWVYSIYPPEMEDASSPYYCNKILYLFTFWKFNITLFLMAFFIVISCIAITIILTLSAEIVVKHINEDNIERG